MKWLKLLFIISMVILFFPLLSSNNVSAGTEDAKMTDFILEATPYRQGLGGEIFLDASVSFYGGCCYPLFAYNLRIVLDLPENIELMVGKVSQTIDEVKAEEGGAATVVNFKWIVRSMIADNYIIKANLTSDNCGNLYSEVNLEINKGLLMSVPKVYPDNPKTDKDTVIIFDVSSALDHIEVDTVNLFYVELTDELPIDDNDIFAENDTLIWSSGTKMGKSFPMNTVENSPKTWRASIPKQNEELVVYFWIVAKDNNGKNTTSIVYSFETFDFDGIYLVIDILNILPIIVTIFGMILIFYLVTKFKTPSDGKGVWLLGNKASKEISSSTSNLQNVSKLNQQRLMVAILLLIFSIILLLWAIYSGQFEEFTQLNGE